MYSFLCIVIMAFYSPFMTMSITPNIETPCSVITNDTPVSHKTGPLQELKVGENGTYLFVPMEDVYLEHSPNMLFYGNFQKYDDANVLKLLTAGFVSKTNFKLGPAYFWAGLPAPNRAEDWFGLYIERGQEGRFVETYYLPRFPF